MSCNALQKPARLATLPEVQCRCHNSSHALRYLYRSKPPPVSARGSLHTSLVVASGPSLVLRQSCAEKPRPACAVAHSRWQSQLYAKHCQANQNETKQPAWRQQHDAWLLLKAYASLLAGLAASVLTLAAPCTAAELPQINPLTEALVDSASASEAATSPVLEVTDVPKGSFSEQNDPVNPFTLFGNTRKKFLIENMEGTKIVSRKKGFTTTTCVSGVAAGAQTKQFEALPESAKSDAADNQLCSKATGPDLQLACQASCGRACTGALDEYADRDSRLTGYSIDARAREKLSTVCARQCTYECAKPGDKYGFAIPYRSRE